MADIQYLNYGDQQIEQQALLNNLANNVQNYVAKQSWSNKRKQKFMSAYSDLMNKGILGASNGTGQWMIDVNGDIDLNSMDRKDREMYQEAAYFIQQQMAGLPTRASQEEKKEEDKSKLPVFDNKAFTSSFINHISTSDFGGQDFHIGGEYDNWNKLDERDSNGVRGKQKRIDALKNYLISYRDKFDDTKYNFEGSPFENAQDFRTRLDNAINALNTPNKDDDEQALNKLGLNPADWFNNGSGDPSDTINPETNQPFTYAELAKYNQDQAKLKAEQDAEANKKKLAQQQANRFNYAVRSNIKMVGQNPQVLAQKYKNDQGILNQLSQYAQSGNITPEQWSEILGAYKFYNSKGVLQNLSKQELDSFNGLRNYNGLGPGVLKKLPGVDGLYFDTRTGQVIKAGRREQQAQKPIQGLLEQNSPEFQQQQYMSNPRGGGVQLTDADKRDIYATLADLGAVVNPEIFSGTALALSASGARTWNSIEQKGLWDTLTDWKTWADWGTGALGGTMLLGDASSAVKFAKGLGKIMTLPAVGMAIYNAPEAKAAWDKIDLKNPIESIKKLTPQDYHALSSFLIGVVSGKNYLRGNVAEREVLKQSGINIESKSKIREYSNKFGITRTKPQNEKTVSTLKVKKTSEDGKIQEQNIQINEKQRAAIQKAKPSEVENVAKAEGVNIPEGYKVEINKSKINSVKSYYQRPFGKANSEIVGKQTESASRGNDNFENWLENRSLWNKWKLGTNSNLRRIRNNIFGKDFDESGLISSASGEESKYAKKPLEQGEIKKSDRIEGLPDKSSKEEIQIRRDVMNDYRKTIKEGKFSSKDMEGGKESIKIGNEDVRVYSTKHADGSPSITITTSKGNHNFRSQEEAKKFIASIVKQQKNNIVSGKITKTNMKEIGKILQDLKRKGWLKQGGTIDKQKIQKYKEFIKK